MKRPITFFSSVCIILFIFAIGWFSYGIYTDRKNGTAAADAEFEKLFTDTTKILSNSMAGSPEFSNQFLRAIENIDDFSSLKLQLNGETVYSYPPAGFSVPSPDLIKSFRQTRMLSNGITVTLSASIYLMKADSIYIHSRLSFILILSGTLIALITLFILKKDKAEKKFNLKESAYKAHNIEEENSNQISNKFSKFADNGAQEEANVNSEEISPAFENILDEPTEETQDEPETQTIRDETLAIQQEQKSEHEIIEEDEVFTDENELPKEESSIPVEEPVGFEETEAESYSEISDFSDQTILDTEQTFDSDTIEFENDYAEDDSYGEIINSDDDEYDPIAALEQQNMELSDFEESDPIFDSEPVISTSIEETMTDNEPIPDFNEIDLNSTISPVTGLQTYTQFEQELAENLVKCSENSSDCAITFIRIENLDRGTSLAKAVVSIINQDIEKDSRIFEYLADGYAIIQPSSDLNKSVDQFDKLYDKITGYLKLNNAVNKVIIGISSVCGRNVSSERIIEEASQALEHADKDPDSPIIAFKANPEKFKEYMTD